MRSEKGSRTLNSYKLTAYTLDSTIIFLESPEVRDGFVTAGDSFPIDFLAV